MTQPTLLAMSSIHLRSLKSSNGLGMGKVGKPAERFRTEGQSQTVTAARDAELYSSALPRDTTEATGKL